MKKIAITALLLGSFSGVVLAQDAASVVQTSIQQDPKISQTRVAVVIPEEIIRRPTPDPAAETAIAGAFTNAGFRTVDLSTQEKNAYRNLIRENNTTALNDIKTRLNADYLVTGEAFAEEYGAIAGGLRAYTARLEVKVIDLASGQIVYSEAFQGSGRGATDSLAGKTALMNVGRTAGKGLPSHLAGIVMGQTQVAPRTLVLRIPRASSFAQVNGLVQRLQARGLGNATIRSMDAGGAIIELASTKTATEIAVLLDSLGFTVSGLTGSEITLQF